MTKKTRLLGVEFGRCLAIYAVVLVHSGDEHWHLPIDNTTIVFRSYFYFAVPFFLATAFYFLIAKSEMAYSLKFWKSKVERIIIPYFVWSTIFWMSRVNFSTLTNKTEELRLLLYDPVSIIFLGGASYQLYFLPLLLSGSTLILLIPLLEKLKIGISTFWILSALSIFLNYLVNVSGNLFQLDKYTAFQKLSENLQIDIQHHPFIRLLLVVVDWVIICLPYFLISVTLSKLNISSKKLIFERHPIIWISLFLLIDLIFKSNLSGFPIDIFLGFTLLLSCISLSNYISIENRLINAIIAKIVVSVGACSYGMYLCHPFLINVVKFMIAKVMPDLVSSVSILSILIISIFSFLSSWVVLLYLSKIKVFSKYLLGI